MEWNRMDDVLKDGDDDDDSDNESGATGSDAGNNIGCDANVQIAKCWINYFLSRYRLLLQVKHKFTITMISECANIDLGSAKSKVAKSLLLNFVFSFLPQLN